MSIPSGQLSVGGIAFPLTEMGHRAGHGSVLTFYNGLFFVPQTKQQWDAHLGYEHSVPKSMSYVLSVSYVTSHKVKVNEVPIFSPLVPNAYQREASAFWLSSHKTDPVTP